MLNRTKKKGFTLIELLVVIAIIGLLTTLALLALDSARKSSRDAKRITDVKQMQTALELYFNDVDGYAGTFGGIPINIGNISGENCNDTGSACICLDSNGFVEACSADPNDIIYMGQLPADPIPASTGDTVEYTYLGLVSGGSCGSDCTSYMLTFELEGSVDDLTKGLNCASPSGIVHSIDNIVCP